MKKKQSAPPETVEEPFFAEANEAITRTNELGLAQNWAAACEALRPLAEDVPGAVDLWLQIAAWERQDGRADDALATLKYAIERNSARPDNLAPLWQAVAAHHFEAQQWPLATEAALEGIEISRALARAPRVPSNASDPESWVSGGALKAPRLREHELLELLATSLAHEGRFEEAGQAMRALLSLSPLDPLHRMRLASLLQSHGALGEASREFERVLEMAAGTFFARDAEAALELLDKAQIQQILTRAGEQRSFGLNLERDMDATLETHAFYLSEGGRESLRQMIDDGRPDLSRAPRIQ